MTERSKSTIRTDMRIAGVIVCAVLLRVFSKMDYFPAAFGILRSFLYIALYITWGVSIRKRVIQVQVCRCLTAVSALMVSWFAVRSMKYFFALGPDIIRHLWYLYYVPMLLIPLFSLFAALSLGKQEDYRLPGRTLLLYIPVVLCLILVLSNDVHQLVFAFPKGAVWTDKDYAYAAGYYFVFGCEVLYALTAFGVMIVKCRTSKRKKYLPIVFIIGSVVYGLTYVSGVQWLQLIGGDLTAAMCLMYTGILESCIQCGLIRSNSGYVTLFEAATLGAQITDTDYRVRYSSANAPKLSEAVMRRAENGTVSLDQNTLLKSSRIDGGHVLWQEDVSDIAALLAQLEENKETIAKNNDLEQENYKTKLKINTLREKNRLYDQLQEQTMPQIELIYGLLSQYDTETDEAKRRSLLARITVAGAYIKRRGNLMFIGEKSETMDLSELELCLDESFANLELVGVECAIDFPQKGLIFVRDAVRIYDFFEAAAEASMENLHSIWLKARSLADMFFFYFELECDRPLSDLAKLAENCVFEDGVWRFTLRIGKAGELS